MAAPTTIIRSWVTVVRTISRSTSGRFGGAAMIGSAVRRFGGSAVRRFGGAAMIASAVETIAVTMRFAMIRRSSLDQVWEFGSRTGLRTQLGRVARKTVKLALPPKRGTSTESDAELSPAA